MHIRATVLVPLIERKIGEVLRSTDPLERFTDKTVDPQRFVSIAALSIAWSGDEQALKEIGKLIAIDEKRFGTLVRNTLLAASRIKRELADSLHDDMFRLAA
jgi:hypothetical protein